MKRRLIEQRDRLLVDMEALRNKVAGLEMAIALLDGEEQLKPTPRASNVRGAGKGAVLDLLTEAGTTGLNAAIACETAERRGIQLDRSSVSSLLSRLKREGTVVYENDRYKLREFSKSPTGQERLKVVADAA